jgi:hypothetical protein
MRNPSAATTRMSGGSRHPPGHNCNRVRCSAVGVRGSCPRFAEAAGVKAWQNRCGSYPCRKRRSASRLSCSACLVESETGRANHEGHRRPGRPTIGRAESGMAVASGPNGDGQVATALRRSLSLGLPVPTQVNHKAVRRRRGYIPCHPPGPLRARLGIFRKIVLVQRICELCALPS